MVTTIIIPITELTEQIATRARGKEAYGNLVKKISDVEERPLDIIIDVSSVEMITGSFLDELVLRTSELHSDTRIIFRLASETQSDILKKICAVRNTCCKYQIGNSGSPRHTRKTTIPRIEAEEYQGAFFTA